MRIRSGQCDLELLQGDITRETTDAIVNAAKSSLTPGGGVDGAIHRAAGPGIHQELKKLYPSGCPTGQSVITHAGNLPVKFIIHTVGPIWRGGRQQEPQLLASCFSTALELALQHNCSSISFPAISTGIYGYPLDLASRTSLRQILEFLEQHQAPSLVRFVLFDQSAYSAYSCAMEELIHE